MVRIATIGLGLAAVTVAATGLAQVRAHAQAAASPATLAIPPATIIQARQTTYDYQYAALLAMKQALADKVDLKVYKYAANAMVRWGSILPAMFPPGSDVGAKTKALPAVWTDRAEFLRDAQNFTAQATKLAAAASADDRAAFAGAFKATGDACLTCHRKFRAK